MPSGQETENGFGLSCGSHHLLAGWHIHCVSKNISAITDCGLTWWWISQC